jgi:hypothetical protein
MEKEFIIEFLPYELALKMKQLGFDGLCFAIWSGFDEQNFSITDTIRLYSSGFRINGTQSSKFYVNDFNSLRVAAPTFSQALRWFREKYNIHSFIIPLIDEVGFVYKYQARVHTKESAVEIIGEFETYEEAEIACFKKIIEIVEQKNEN